jgi:hypothetical protein
MARMIWVMEGAAQCRERCEWGFGGVVRKSGVGWVGTGRVGRVGGKELDGPSTFG